MSKVGKHNKQLKENDGWEQQLATHLTQCRLDSVATSLSFCGIDCNLFQKLRRVRKNTFSGQER